MQGVGDLEAGGKLDLRAAESRGGRETGAQQAPGVGGGQRQGPVRVPWGPGSGPAWPHPTVHLTVSFARPDSARPCASCFGCHQHVTWGHSEWLTWVDRRGTKEPSDDSQGLMSGWGRCSSYNLLSRPTRAAHQWVLTAVASPASPPGGPGA